MKNPWMVRCHKCKDKHLYSERKLKPGYGGMSYVVCPRCGASEYSQLEINPPNQVLQPTAAGVSDSRSNLQGGG